MLKIKKLIIFFFLLAPYCAIQADEIATYSQANRISNQLNAYILSKDFSTLEQEIKHYIDNKIRTSTGDIAIIFLLNLIFDNNIENLETPLNTLNSQNKKSYVANLLLAKYYYDLAWHCRGEKFINNTETLKLRNYHNLLTTSHKLFLQLLDLDKNSYLTNYYLFLMSKELGTNESERNIYFSIADKQVNNFLSLYLAKTDSLAPKWGGSEESLMQFVEQNAWSNNNSSLPFIVPAAYSNICNEYGGKKVLFKKTEVWNKIESAYKLLLSRFPKAAHFKINYASALIAHGDKQKAFIYIKEARTLDPDHPEVIRLAKKYSDKLNLSAE